MTVRLHGRGAVEFQVRALADGLLEGCHRVAPAPDEVTLGGCKTAVAGTYALQFLAVAAKCAPLAEFVTLTLVSGDMPLKVEFDLEPGVVTYFVAPKCGSDDGAEE